MGKVNSKVIKIIIAISVYGLMIIPLREFLMQRVVLQIIEENIAMGFIESYNFGNPFLLKLSIPNIQTLVLIKSPFGSKFLISIILGILIIKEKTVLVVSVLIAIQVIAYFYSVIVLKFFVEFTFVLLSIDILVKYLVPMFSMLCVAYYYLITRTNSLGKEG